jgi:hypothetical protein
VKYKIVTLGNQCRITQIKNGETLSVGKILLKPNKSIFFLIDSRKAKQTIRVMNDKLILNLTSESYSLKAIKENSNQQVILNWKDESKKKILFKCLNHNGLYYLQMNKNTLARVKEISKEHFLFEITQPNEFPQVVLLACLFPLFFS